MATTPLLSSFLVEILVSLDDASCPVADQQQILPGLHKLTFTTSAGSDVDLTKLSIPPLFKPGGPMVREDTLILEPGTIPTTLDSTPEERQAGLTWIDTAYAAFKKGLQAHNTESSSNMKWPTTPEALTKPLHPHQLEACGRISHAQQSGKAGFLLADDTGLGKTMVAIAIIAQNPGPRPNLIVAPASLCSTWKDAVADFVSPRTLSCHLYRGPESSRQLTTKQLKEVNIIIVSYDTLRSQKSARDKFLKNLAHERYDPVECPVNRPASHFRLPKCPLLEIGYERVFYDEAHTFCNRASPTHRACFQVSSMARFRVAITATVVRNGFDDLWPYVSILRFEPFNRPAIFNSVCQLLDPSFIHSVSMLCES